MAGAMSEYERRRAENIARNAEMLAQLGVEQSARNLLIAKPTRNRKAKGYQPDRRKRPREEVVVPRRSRRTQGIAPEVELQEALDRDVSSHEEKKFSSGKPVAFSAVCSADQQSDESCRDRIMAAAEEEPICRSSSRGDDSFNPITLKLAQEDVVRVVPEKIYSLLLLPLSSRSVVLAGDKAGNIGLWDADHNANDDEEDIFHIYHPHRAPVAAIASAPIGFGKIATCSYDGYVLLMDIGKAHFRSLYSGSDPVSAMSYSLQDNGNVICIGEGEGEMRQLDVRSSKSSFVQKVHEKRVNSIDFNPQVPHLVATSSTDGTVSIWDLRKSGSRNNVATMSHQRAVHSAYFSPSGNQLASTSYDNHVGLWSGKAEDDPVMISHNNQTNRWIATFRAIWSKNNNYVFIADMTRAIDIISTREKKVIASLKSEEMSSIPSRLAQHPLLPGVLAGGTAGGKIFLWRS